MTVPITRLPSTGASFGAVLLGAGVAGVVAGIAWVQFARPSQWEDLGDQLVMGEAAATGQFQVVASFAVIGTLVGFLGGVAGHRWMHRGGADPGWIVVPLMAAAAVVASVIAWRLGVVWGPPDPATSAGADGPVFEQLSLDVPGAFIVWAAAAAAGVGVSTLARRDDRLARRDQH